MHYGRQIPTYLFCDQFAEAGPLIDLYPIDHFGAGILSDFGRSIVVVDPDHAESDDNSGHARVSRVVAALDALPLEGHEARAVILTGMSTIDNYERLEEHLATIRGLLHPAGIAAVLVANREYPHHFEGAYTALPDHTEVERRMRKHFPQVNIFAQHPVYGAHFVVQGKKVRDLDPLLDDRLCEDRSDLPSHYLYVGSTKYRKFDESVIGRLPFDLLAKPIDESIRSLRVAQTVARNEQEALSNEVSRLLGIQKELEAKATEVGRINREKEARDHKIVELERDLNRKEELVQELQQSNSRASSRLAHLDDDLHNSQLEVLKQRSETSELQKAKEILSSEIEQVRKEHTASSRELVQIKTEAASAARELDIYRAEKTNLESDLKERQVDISHLQNEVNDAREEIHRISHELNSSSIAIDSHIKHNAQIEERLLQTEDERGHIDSEYRAALRAEEDWRARERKLSEELRDKEFKLEDTTSKLDQSERQLQAIKEQLAKTTGELETAEISAEEFSTELATALLRKDQLEKDLSNLQVEHEEVILNLENERQRHGEIESASRTLTAEVSKRQQKIEALEAQVGELSNEAASRQIEAESASAKLLSLEQTRQKLMQELEEELARSAQSSDMVRELERKLSGATKALKVSDQESSRNTALEQQIDALQEQIQERNAELQLVKREYDKTCRELDRTASLLETRTGELDTARDELATIKDDLHSAQETERKLETHLRKLADERTELNSSLEQTREQLSEITGAYEALERSLRETEKNGAQAQDEVSGLKAAYEKSLGDVSKIAQELQQLGEEHDTLEEELEQVEADKTSAQNKLTIKAADLDKSNELIDELKQQLSIATEALEKRDTNLDKLNSGLGATEDELNDTREQLSQAHKELDQARTHAQKANKERVQLAERLRLTENKQRSEDDELSRIKQQLEVASGDLTAKESRVTQLLGELENAESKATAQIRTLEDDKKIAAKQSDALELQIRNFKAQIDNQKRETAKLLLLMEKAKAKTSEYADKVVRLQRELSAARSTSKQAEETIARLEDSQAEAIRGDAKQQILGLQKLLNETRRKASDQFKARQKAFGDKERKQLAQIDQLLTKERELARRANETEAEMFKVGEDLETELRVKSGALELRENEVWELKEEIGRLRAQMIAADANQQEKGARSDLQKILNQQEKVIASLSEEREKLRKDNEYQANSLEIRKKNLRILAAHLKKLKAAVVSAPAASKDPKDTVDEMAELTIKPYTIKDDEIASIIEEAGGEPEKQ